MTILQSLMELYGLKLNMHLNLFSVSTEPEALALPSRSYKKNYASGSTELTIYASTLSAILCILMLVAVAIFLKRRKRTKEKNTSK